MPTRHPETRGPRLTLEEIASRPHQPVSSDFGRNFLIKPSEGPAKPWRKESPEERRLDPSLVDLCCMPGCGGLVPLGGPSESLCPECLGDL